MNDRSFALIEDPQGLLATIVASTDDVIVSKTLDGVITSWNPAAERLFGYSAAEAVGQSIKLIIPLERHGEEDEILARIRCGERVDHFETVRLARDGRRLDFSVTISPLRDSHGAIVGALKVGRDITAASAAQRKAESAQQILRRQTVELAESDRRKDEFLATLAHELRNPLAPIRNSLQYLRLKGPPSPELQSARDIIERQVHQLVHLVDDLLDVSRISRGKIDLQKQRADLTMVVESAVESSRPLIDANGHRLTLSLPAAPVEIEADVTRLSQVLQNLLDNAAKYTPRGGSIELAACVEDGEVVIRVRDDGIGIPPDMLDRVFEMFVQVDRRIERASGGLGIGLTLVQRLVTLHGGRVEARSAGPGRGSEFIVRLPLPRAAAPQLATAALRAEGAATPVRVLVVDDNRDGADSLAMMLQALGHEVRVEYDGPRGAEVAADWRPDVALLDIGLPGLSGYDLALQLRASAATRHAVLVAVTGWGQQEDRRRSAQAGFDHHLVKPVNPLHLRVLLNAAAARSRAGVTAES